MNRQELLKEYLEYLDDEPQGKMCHRKHIFVKDKDGNKYEIETHEELWFE